MEITPIKATSEEREEGEIVEDDLEDVSDCSMTPGSPFHSGKSVSPPEPLSAVCLSSVSGSEYSRAGGRRARDQFQHYGKSQPKRRMYRRKRKLAEHVLRRKGGHHLRHHRKSVGSNSESESESVDPKYAKQLREALQRESSQELHNSLKTRLKAFIEPNSQSDDETSLTALRDFALLSTLKNIEDADDKATNESQESGEVQSTNESKAEEQGDECDLKLADQVEEIKSDKHESIDDPELRELRIAALKSFVMENHERRKKKAIIQDCNVDNLCSGSSNKDDASDIDKENDQSMINNDLDGRPCKRFKPDTEKTESEDVMRQQADSSPINVDDKTVDSPSANHVETLMDEDADILRAMLLASLASKITEKKSMPTKSGFSNALADIRKVEKSKTNYNSLSVTISKPMLKRTIKNDLYSKTTNSNEQVIIKASEPLSMPNHVVVKPLIININGESDSDTENYGSINEDTNKTIKANVTEFLKKQRAEVEAAVKKKPASSDSSLNKSDDPLMEKSVMKLLPRSQQLEYRKLKQQLLNARKRTRIRRLSQRLSENKREASQNNKKVPKFKTDATACSGNPVSNKIIKNVQEKIEPTSNLQKTLSELQFRKNGRLQMKGKYRSLAPLLHRINQASNERRQHEHEIKTLLQEIQNARTKLAASHQNFTDLVQQLLNEKGTIDQRLLKLTKISHVGPITSTPNKSIKEQMCDISSVKQSTAIVEISTTLISSTKVDSNTRPAPSPKVASEPAEANATSRNDEPQDEEVLLDPNDVTKVFVEQPMLIPKYTSPLDNREGINDPLTTICPYDLLGVCKDKECRYVHCS